MKNEINFIGNGYEEIEVNSIFNLSLSFPNINNRFLNYFNNDSISLFLSSPKIICKELSKWFFINRRNFICDKKGEHEIMYIKLSYSNFFRCFDEIIKNNEKCGFKLYKCGKNNKNWFQLIFKRKKINIKTLLNSLDTFYVLVNKKKWCNTFENTKPPYIIALTKDGISEITPPHKEVSIIPIKRNKINLNNLVINSKKPLTAKLNTQIKDGAINF